MLVQNTSCFSAHTLLFLIDDDNLSWFVSISVVRTNKQTYWSQCIQLSFKLNVLNSMLAKKKKKKQRQEKKKKKGNQSKPMHKCAEFTSRMRILVSTKYWKFKHKYQILSFQSKRKRLGKQICFQKYFCYTLSLLFPWQRSFYKTNCRPFLETKQRFMGVAIFSHHQSFF